jgi:HPt (histidine-containing phosphotransfer) domain-containing protein
MMIRWERVNELRDEVGADDFKEVVDLFLEEVEEVIERLRDSPDPTRFEEDFHFLKGSALNLGFGALGDLCQTGERQPGAVDLASVVATYEASKAEFMASAARMGFAA